MRILILSPHTDDAELGAGGTIVKFLEQKHDICWIVFSSAQDSLPQEMPRDTLRNEFKEVIEFLGSSIASDLLDYKVRNFDKHRQEILDKLISIRKKFDPDLVLGPSLNDFHQDHHVISNEMVRAFKSHSSIISYEMPWNNLNFNTQLFSKLSDTHMKKKYEMLKKYSSQFKLGRKYFEKEAVYGLARVRGIQCNSKYAEAFEVVRWMI